MVSTAARDEPRHAIHCLFFSLFIFAVQRSKGATAAGGGGKGAKELMPPEAAAKEQTPPEADKGTTPDRGGGKEQRGNSIVSKHGGKI